MEIKRDYSLFSILLVSLIALLFLYVPNVGAFLGFDFTPTGFEGGLFEGRSLSFSPTGSTLSLELTEYDSIESQLYKNPQAEIKDGQVIITLEPNEVLKEEAKVDYTTIDKDEALCDKYKTYYSTDAVTEKFDCLQIKEDLTKIVEIGIPTYTKGYPVETKTIDEKITDQTTADTGAVAVGGLEEPPIVDPKENVTTQIVTYTFDASNLKAGDTFQIGDHSIVYTVVASQSNVFNNQTLTEPNNITHLAPSNIAPYNSLVAYLSFDSDEYPDKTSAGKIGNGLNFNIASSQIVNFGTSAGSLHPTSNAVNYTWIGWVKPYSLNGSTNSYIFSRYGSNGGFNIGLDNGATAAVKDGNFWVWWDNGVGSAIFLDGGTNYEIGNWTQIAVTYSGAGDDKFRFYKNGVLTNTSVTASDYNPAAASAITVLGRYSADLLGFFNGTMDEIKIFNRTLEATEIANIYGNESLNVSYSALNTTGLVAEYNLNYTKANGVINSRGNIYTGTPIGYGTWSAYDYSSNSNEGSYNNRTYTNTGLYDDSAYFDGVNDYISLTTGIVMNETNSSISLWFNCRTFANSQCIFTGKPANNNNYIYFPSATQLDIQTDVGSTLKSYTFSALSTNTWYHLVVTRNSGTTRAYINNIESSSGGQTQNDILTISQLGRYSTASTPYLNGSLDEVMIFNVSLNSSQISQIFQNTSQRFYPQGQATIKFQNITADGNNTINLSVSILENNYQSNVSARIGSWNVTNGYNQNNESLLGYWNFESNPNNTAKANGAYPNGSVQGNPTYVNGVFGNAINFDGDDYIEVGNGATNNTITGTSPRTISAWFKACNLCNPTDGGGIAGYGAGANDQSFVLYIQADDTAEINVWGANNLAGGKDIGDGQWHHLVGTYNGTTAVLWVDGVQNITKTVALNTASTRARIGRLAEDFGGNTYRVNGTVDEVMFFNRTLSNNEIKELYLTGKVSNIGVNWSYGNYANITAPNTNVSLSFTPYATNILPDFLESPTPTTQFYTPLFGGTINLDSYFIAPAPSNIAPVVYLNSPANGTIITNGGLVYFAANFTDDVGLNNTFLRLWNNTALVASNYTAISGTINSTNLSLTLPHQGIFRWNYETNDTGGLWGSNSTNWTIIYDNIAPTILSLSETPTDPATYSPNQFYEFNVTIADAQSSINTVVIEFNGVNYTSALNQVLNRGSGIYTLNRTDLGAGTYNYYWYANDSAGNNNQTAMQSYTINKASPTITLTIDDFATNRTVLSGVAVSLNASQSTGQGQIQLISIGNIIGQAPNSILNSTTYTGSGSKNVTAFYPASQNYSAGSLTRWVDLLSTGGSICGVSASASRVNATAVVIGASSWDSSGTKTTYSLTGTCLNNAGQLITFPTFNAYDTGSYNATYTISDGGTCEIRASGESCSVAQVSWNSYYGNNTIQNITNTYNNTIIINNTITPTPSGYTTLSWLYLLFFILGLCFLIFGYTSEKTILSIFGGMIFAIMAVSFGTEGIPNITNQFLQTALIVIFAGVGLYYLIAPGIEAYFKKEEEAEEDYYDSDTY